MFQNRDQAGSSDANASAGFSIITIEKRHDRSAELWNRTPSSRKAGGGTAKAFELVRPPDELAEVLDAALFFPRFRASHPQSQKGIGKTRSELREGSG